MTLDHTALMTPDCLQLATWHHPPRGAYTVETSLLDQLTIALKKAVDENAQRSRLMALAGHDLKQPLQVISMLLGLLAVQNGTVSMKPQLELAHQSIRRIADGLDRLALASRMTVDLDAPRRTTFPITDILKLIEPTWREHAAQQHVRFTVVPSSACVTSDIAMLTTILDNLVGNAIKYTPDGRVLIGCRRINDHVSIQVLDNGLGIRNEQLQQIFVAFHQEDSSADGLGLGLSIVGRTAATLGHRIRVESIVGRGSAFCVDVPMAPVALSLVHAAQVIAVRAATMPSTLRALEYYPALALQRECARSAGLLASLVPLNMNL